MSESSSPPASDGEGADALTRARRTRVVVVGGGIAGLTASLEWAKIGASVTLLEAEPRLGGRIETARLDGLAVDLVADAFPLDAERLGALIDELGLRDRVEPAAPHGEWIAGIGGGSAAAPLPAAAVLGIPANPWAVDTRRIIGWGGVWRAYLDRLRPPLTIGRERRLGVLVRSRMGDRVVERLVAPLTRGRYGLDPDDIDVDAAAPGLNAALTRVGSLTGAVAALLPDATETIEATPPTRGTLRGGMGGLIDAVASRLDDFRADIRVGVRVTALVAPSADDDAWSVVFTDPEDADAAPLSADRIILATGASAAGVLSSTAGVELTDVSPPLRRDVVTMVVSAPALDAAPRGRVYPAHPTDAALSLSHASADWPWLARDATAGRHVLRVVLTAQPDRSDADTLALALTEASSLLGMPLAEPAAVMQRRGVELPAPASALGHEETVSAVRAAVSAQPGLAIVGSWVSGDSLGHVVADAVAEVDRQRAEVLWGASDRPAAS